ncbi:AraC family transcriptional regulator [Paenibacillus alginolyticus]|uniref:AraC family transcriptional regulator n=1 Tax=Paenibacillus alginolyticus TaxID=59839 RepID=A0ABT4G6Q6_9BACL|nr:AraC family transcriptional regulator [Paenibacillus alginolyticus]MCY9669363.1 AraC family transcriptional regulator [Paenibacillus alginolyticus]MCY9691861.1 AraC family transcriptional regulator [Paenibacillus alginolyticus]MEC0142153.1 AraC family transcriptional regulator [Paenibacillus alginolyticus]
MEKSPRWTYDINKENRLLGVPELLLFGFDEIRSAMPLSYHQHAGYEFVLVERGKASWELDGHVYETKAGDVFHTSPGEIHRGGFNVIEPSRFWWFIVTPPHSEGWLRLPQDESEGFRVALEALPRVTHTGLQAVDDIRKLRNALNSNSPLRTSATRQALLGLLLLILQPNQQIVSLADDLLHQLDALIGRITEEPQWRPAIEEMADLVRISPSHFFRTFQEYTGLPPMVFIERARIKKACGLLVEGTDTVTEVANELGYASSQHFATVFKRITGMTPIQWRKFQTDRNDSL